MKHLIGIALGLMLSLSLYRLGVEPNWAAIFLIWMAGWEFPEVVKWIKRRYI